ncbi:UDP-N-acetylmuramate dehydrogenase [Bacilli bacterium PM5-9]|nr:UDP-N-acetylmuramate dehydrogenase [Bacilli bacterium PM5-9]
MENKIITDLKKLGVMNIFKNEPLYKYTTYRVGGPALVYVDAASFSDVTKTIDYALENKIKYFVLGNGSNVLVSDNVFSGIVISTRKLDSYEISGNNIYAMCGVNLINLAFQSAKEGLSGLEFASGIPGLIGGSVFMNAGAYKKEMSDIITRVLLYRNGKQEWVDKSEMEFSYRHSILQKHRDWIVLAVDIALVEHDKDDIIELIEQRKQRRQSTQPYDAFSAGSVFKNPSDSLYSWQLIDQAKLRGYHINDAQVSIKHSNFIINLDRASAKDIYDLINYVKDKVYETSEIELKTEIELVNFDEEE